MIPNVKPTTYRDLYKVLYALSDINHYVSTHPDLKNPLVFDLSFQNTLQIEDRDSHIVTAANYQLMADMVVPYDDLVMYFSPYTNMSETLIRSEPLRGIPYNPTEYDRYYLTYDSLPSVPRCPKETRFFTRILGSRKQDQTSVSVSDFRLFYSSYAFWHHKVLASHYLTGSYKFEGIKRPGPLEGPVLETLGYTYDVDRNPLWVSWDDDMVHKACCTTTTFQEFRHYFNPIKIANAKPILII